jgi:hypothetical protein
MDNLEPAGAETPAAEVVTHDAPTEATVETSEATTEQQPEADNPEETTDDKPKKKHWAYDRIDELTRRRREAEREAEYWKAKANTSVDFDALEYEDGIAERVAQKTRKEQAETAEQTAHRLASEVFGHREAMVREQYPDYDAVTRSPNVTITELMAQVIMDSETGPEVAYHLGKNPAEAARIAALPPHLQARELGKLEATITAPKPAPKLAPAPVKPVSGIAAGGSRDPGTMSMAEYAAWRNQGNG